MKSWHLTITPQVGYRDDPKLGRVEIRHAQSMVWYHAESLKQTIPAGKVHIAFLPNKFDCVHKLPHTDQLGKERVAEIMDELKRMTGRPLIWAEHYKPYVLVKQSDVTDLDEASGEVVELD